MPGMRVRIARLQLVSEGHLQARSVAHVIVFYLLHLAFAAESPAVCRLSEAVLLVLLPHGEIDGKICKVEH